MAREKEMYEKSLARVQEKIRSSDMCKGNANAILRFSDFCFSDGLSVRRVLKYMYTLRTLEQKFKREFATATREDIQRLVRDIECSEYSDWTKHDFRVTLKKFYRWLRGTEDYPDEVKWIRTGCSIRHKRMPEELLTPEEIESLITAARNDRDRALIACLYESGCRIGELLWIKTKNIQRHAHGFQIMVTGKTGTRRLLLIVCTEYLTTWLNQHPRRDDPDAPLWITGDSNASQISYAKASSIIHMAARRARIRKAVNPHNFRHSRATHLANHLTEAQMNEYFGWVQGSDMASTYVHLSGRDIDNALLKMHEIPVSDNAKRQRVFATRHCGNCELENPPGNKFCSRCGNVLDKEKADELMKENLDRAKIDRVMDDILQDEEFREMFGRKVTEWRDKRCGA